MALAAPAPQMSARDAATPGIVSFLSGFSIEVTRPNAADIEALSAAAPQATRIYLSSVPNRPPEDIAAYAAAIAEAGFEPVPHLAVRNFSSQSNLADLLARLAGKARSALVIAGDRDRPAGPFACAKDIIESGLLQQHGIADVGIAGYPEGHPRISADALDRALAAKIEAAEQSGLNVHIVTQFGFDAEAIVRWIGRLRDQGFEHPVRIGMAGPTNPARLLRYASRCGVLATASGLARQSGLVKNLFGLTAPDRLVLKLADAATGGRLGEVSAHFFSFGGAGACARWVQAAACGRITADGSGGFSVAPP